MSARRSPPRPGAGSRRRPTPTGPLAGLRVLSLAQHLPGPLAVARLVAAGATAIKIEPPAGDAMGRFSPEWYRRLHRGVAVERVDLKQADGQRHLGARLAAADLLITSQRPSALRRLGLAPRTLARAHPHLRWLEIVGDTAAPERPGHDLTYQAEAGLLGQDMPRTLVADLLGAEAAAFEAVLLLRRAAPARARVGLRDALAPAAAAHDLGLTAATGLLGGGWSGYRIYAAREGRVAVAVLEPHFRARLYAELGLAEGADLSRAMRRRTARQWERWAAARDLPLAWLRE